MISTGKFISIWDGEEIITECKIDTDTKEVFDIQLSKIVPDGICEGEFVELDNKRYEVYNEDQYGDGEYWYK